VNRALCCVVVGICLSATVNIELGTEEVSEEDRLEDSPNKQKDRIQSLAIVICVYRFAPRYAIYVIDAADDAMLIAFEAVLIATQGRGCCHMVCKER